MLLENIQEKFQHIDKFLNIEFESVQGNESTVGQSKEIVDLGTDGRTDDVQNGSRQFKYSTSLSFSPAENHGIYWKRTREVNERSTLPFLEHSY